MEPVILALAEALWPALEQQDLERSAENDSAMSRYFSLSGADIHQLPEEVRDEQACNAMLPGHAATVAIADKP
jgi:hypothetical protein